MNYRIVFANVVMLMAVAAYCAYVYGAYSNQVVENESLRKQLADRPVESVVPQPAPVPAQTANNTPLADEKNLARADTAETALADLQSKYDSLQLSFEKQQRQIELLKNALANNPGRTQFTPEFEREIAAAKKVYQSVDSQRRTQERYGQFLETLEGDTATQAREILSRVLFTVEPDHEDYVARVQEALSGVLSREELQALSEYESIVPQIMLRQKHDAEIAVFASDLPLESRNIVVDTLVANLPSIEQTDLKLPSVDALIQQIDAFESTAEALPGLIPESEIPSAMRYISSQIQLLQTQRVFNEAKRPK